MYRLKASAEPTKTTLAAPNAAVSWGSLMLTVLVVDDDATWRKAIIRRTRGVGADSISQGLSLAEKLQPDVILLDVRFDGPWQTGIDAIGDFLKASPESAIIVVTNLVNGYDRKRALASGAALYLDKSDPRIIAPDGVLAPRGVARRAPTVDLPRSSTKRAAAH